MHLLINHYYYYYYYDYYDDDDDDDDDKVAWFRTRRVLLGFIVVTLQERESSQLQCSSIETTIGISSVLLEII